MPRDDYHGRYRGIYPIKVNQQKSVVDALLAHGAERLAELEAGSKPELLAVLARSRGLTSSCATVIRTASSSSGAHRQADRPPRVYRGREVVRARSRDRGIEGAWNCAVARRARAPWPRSAPASGRTPAATSRNSGCPRRGAARDRASARRKSARIPADDALSHGLADRQHPAHPVRYARGRALLCRAAQTPKRR